MFRDEILQEEELLEYLDTERRLDRLDRRLKFRKAFYISLVAVLLCGLVIYAVRIERKISALSEQQPVIIYINNETTAESLTVDITEPFTNYIENSTIPVTTETSETMIADNENLITENDIYVQADDKSHSDMFVQEPENVTDIYYVTKTGTKYHIGSCSHLSKSKIPMDYNEIVAKGYKPCSKCIS